LGLLLSIAYFGIGPAAFWVLRDWVFCRPPPILESVLWHFGVCGIGSCRPSPILEWVLRHFGVCGIGSFVVHRLFWNRSCGILGFAALGLLSSAAYFGIGPAAFWGLRHWVSCRPSPILESVLRRKKVSAQSFFKTRTNGNYVRVLPYIRAARCPTSDEVVANESQSIAARTPLLYLPPQVDEMEYVNRADRSAAGPRCRAAAQSATAAAEASASASARAAAASAAAACAAPASAAAAAPKRQATHRWRPHGIAM